MKTGRILAGYRVDGVAFYAQVKLADGDEVCRQCQGTGQWEYDAGHDGFERRETMECENCDGEGVVHAGTEDDEA